MFFFWIVLLISFFLDVFTKHLVDKKMKIGQKKEICGDHFFLWHIKNKGVAYNKFADHPHGVIGFSAMMIAMIFFFGLSTLKEERHRGILFFSATFFGGALGNLVERVQKKHVTDFLYFKGRNLPIFNFADIFIVLGSIGYVLSRGFGKENK